VDELKPPSLLGLEVVFGHETSAKAVESALYPRGGIRPERLDNRREKEVRMAGSKRTTHRSSSGKKLYAVRDSSGKFKDIQTYKRAHGADIKRKSKAESKSSKKK
jgi:hypothetical protein